MHIIPIPSLDRITEAADEFISGLTPGAVYAFHAPMGAGKTTFISEVCRRLGVDDIASSPTFSIINEYSLPDGRSVYHLDCYRLEGPEEGYEIGLEDLFASGHTCFVEWPENIGSLLPEEAIPVKITVESDGSRTLTVDDIAE